MASLFLLLSLIITPTPSIAFFDTDPELAGLDAKLRECVSRVNAAGGTIGQKPGYCPQIMEHWQEQEKISPMLKVEPKAIVEEKGEEPRVEEKAAEAGPQPSPPPSEKEKFWVKDASDAGVGFLWNFWPVKENRQANPPNTKDRAGIYFDTAKTDPYTATCIYKVAPDKLHPEERIVWVYNNAHHIEPDKKGRSLWKRIVSGHLVKAKKYMRDLKQKRDDLKEKEAHKANGGDTNQVGEEIQKLKEEINAMVKECLCDDCETVDLAFKTVEELKI